MHKSTRMHKRTHGRSLANHFSVYGLALCTVVDVFGVFERCDAEDTDEAVSRYLSLLHAAFGERIVTLIPHSTIYSEPIQLDVPVIDPVFLAEHPSAHASK